MAQRDDETELLALRAGDRSTTERFVRQHVGWMLTVANRIVRDEGRAEDVAQNAFAKVFRNLDAFDGRSAVKTWMHRIVVNEALMDLRKIRRRKEDLPGDLLPKFDDQGCRFEEAWTTFETPETLIQQSQTRDMVKTTIGQLPQNYRIVLTLRDIEDMSTAEVAALLELSEANVKVRLHRARAALKKLLEPLIRGQSP